MTSYFDTRFDSDSLGRKYSRVTPAGVRAWDSSGNYYVDAAEQLDEWEGMHTQAGIAKYSGNHRLWRYYLSSFWYDYYSVSDFIAPVVDTSLNVYIVGDYTFRPLSYDPFYSGVRVIKLSPAGSLLWTQTEQAEGLFGTTKSIAVSPNGFCVTKWLADGSIAAFSPGGDALWKKSGYGYGNDAQIHIGVDGFIYVRDDNGLHKIDVAGRLIWSNTEVA